MGATGSGIYPQDTPQTVLLSGLIRQIMGTAGIACLGGAVTLACLTTAVGLGSTVVSFLYTFFREKIPYKVLLLIACLIGVFMGITGVQNIVNYVTPIFLVIYPACIVTTVLGLLNRFLPNDGFYKGGVLVALILSLGAAVLSVFPNLEWLKHLMSIFPLAEMGFAWLIPSIIGMFVGGLLYRGKPKFSLPVTHAGETSSVSN